jgi:hypothetical protein
MRRVGRPVLLREPAAKWKAAFAGSNRASHNPKKVRNVQNARGGKDAGFGRKKMKPRITELKCV